MRRAAAYYLAIVALLMILLAPLLLVATSSGLRWALAYVEARYPLRVEGVGGSLLSGVDLKELHYVDGGLKVAVQNLSLALGWRCALRSTLCIERLSAQHVALALPPSDPSADKTALQSPLPWLPFGLDIRELSVVEFEVVSDGQLQRLENVALSGDLNARRALVQAFSVTHELGKLSLGAQLAPTGVWELEAELSVAEDAPLDWPAELPRAYTLRGDGDLQSAQALIRAITPEELALDLDLRVPADGQALTLRGVLRGVATVVPVLAQSPWTQLDGPLSLALDLPSSGAEVRLQQQLAGYAPESLPLSVNLTEAAGHWSLMSALGDPAAPVLSASGSLGELSDIAADVQIVATDFRPPAVAGLPIDRVSGALGITAVASSPLESWRLSNILLEADEGENHWELSGELRAGNRLVLPIGHVQGSRNDLVFSYDRGSGRLDPARIALPQGINAGELSLAKLILDVAPGENAADSELALSVDGDLSTDLAISLKQTPAGANFTLAAFAVEYEEQVLISEAPVVGRWERDRNVIALEAFCLLWRGSEACADTAQLGQSGELDLRLKVNEAYSGAVSKKPFSIEATGAGQLSLRWADAALQDGNLELELDQLAIDPYLLPGTRSAVSWEQARVSAALTPDKQHVKLDMCSERFGTLAIDVSDTAGSLDGSIRADNIELVALDDLLPEWTLRQGSVNADVRLGGTRSAPLVFGDLYLDGVSAQIPEVDSQLSDTRLRVQAMGESVVLEGSAMLGGGNLTLFGECCDGGELRATLSGERNQLRLPIGLDATMSPQLDMRVNAEQLNVSGVLTVHEGLLLHSGSPAGGVPLSDDVYRIDVEREKPRRFDISADIRTLIEPGFTLRSEELEATLSGDLRLSIRPEQQPALYGDLQILGGELRAYGQALRLTQGSVGFVGDPLNPGLNLSAERRIRAEDLRVGFRVRGSLDEPLFELFSEPQRSERDTLSYLLRGRGPDAGASMDGTAMALSLGASAINQSGVLESLNSIPGLSGVTLGAEGSEEDMAATISAYVGERLYLSYGVGIYEPVNALTARLYLRTRLWLEVVSRLENSFDVYYRFDIQ